MSNHVVLNDWKSKRQDITSSVFAITQYFDVAVGLQPDSLFRRLVPFHGKCLGIMPIKADLGAYRGVLNMIDQIVAQ